MDGRHLYQWSKGDLEEVSTEPELKYNFTSGGSYYVHLNVTDGKVGKTVNYQVNVNRTFENGYLITSSDADGKGNLSFVKILTPEEIAAGEKEVVVEHCMEKSMKMFRKMVCSRPSLQPPTCGMEVTLPF